MSNKYYLEYRHLIDNDLIVEYRARLPKKKAPILDIEFLVDILHTRVSGTNKERVCRALKNKVGVVVLNIKEYKVK